MCAIQVFIESCCLILDFFTLDTWRLKIMDILVTFINVVRGDKCGIMNSSLKCPPFPPSTHNRLVSPWYGDTWKIHNPKTSYMEERIWQILKWGARWIHVQICWNRTVLDKVTPNMTRFNIWLTWGFIDWKGLFKFHPVSVHLKEWTPKRSK